MARTNRFVYVAAAIAAINGALFGYDTGIISGALLYIKQDFALSNFLQELVVSGVLVGAVLGAAVGGRLADRLGRRRTILITVSRPGCSLSARSAWGWRRAFGGSSFSASWRGSGSA